MRMIDADALWEKMYKYTDNEGAKMPYGDDDSLIHRDSACFLIEEAPTINPEPHWFPVTERLPKVGREILFCDIDGDIFVGHRATEHWWSVDDKVKNVIAWCELPEPFKGVTE